MDPVMEIIEFMLNALRKAWPFIVLSIPLSVAVNVSGASEQIRGILGKNPVISILLATLFGALSPLCSCTVIPVIFSLLTAGVPIGPVMAFWIASPSMDPEIFFLSVSTLGWELAIWRLASTFVLSLGAGFMAHILYRRGWFSEGILRAEPQKEQMSLGSLMKRLFIRREPVPAATSACCSETVPVPVEKAVVQVQKVAAGAESCGCGTVEKEQGYGCGAQGASCCSAGKEEAGCGSTDSSCGSAERKGPMSNRILKESGKSLIFVGKFLLIAYFIEALIVLYLPAEWIESVLGKSGPGSIVWATLFGLPFYTTNLAALGILGGLLEKGMIPAAALAFLISGPTTTLPAMSAVFGIARPKVFLLYLGISLWGAVLFGMLFLVF